MLLASKLKTSLGPKYTYLGSYTSEVDGTSFTFSSKNIGRASPSRRIVLTIAARRSTFGALTISSTTVGGISGTTIVSQQSTDISGALTAIVLVEIPSGNTGDVVINLSATTNFILVGVHALYGLASSTAIDTDTDTNPAGDLTMSLFSAKGDRGVAIFYAEGISGAPYMTGGEGLEQVDSNTSLPNSSGIVVGGGILTGYTAINSVMTGPEFDCSCAASWR